MPWRSNGSEGPKQMVYKDYNRPQLDNYSGQLLNYSRFMTSPSLYLGLSIRVAYLRTCNNYSRRSDQDCHGRAGGPETKHEVV